MRFINILNIFDWIGENIINGIAGFFFQILLWLDSAIYSFISYIYNIFLLLAGGGSIFNNNQISDLVNRIYAIIGVVVLFLAAYSLLKSMVNPDESLKGKKSPINIIKDVVISIVLIAFIPTIFDFAFEFQNSLLVENTIGKIIAGSPGGSSETEETIRMGGYNMAEGVLSAFIYVNPDANENGTPYCRDKSEEESLTSDGKTCTPLYVNSSTTYGTLWENARKNTSFSNLQSLAPLISDGKVNYIFLLDAVAGVFVLFVLLQYCLDMALRLVKLAVYELIAPLPILARIMPNEQAGKVFTNWTKATISTFVEVFIRIAILYFAVILISTVGDSLLNLFGGGALNFANDEALFLTKSIAHALIIVGIILFIKQAPEIIKEITGLDGGKYNVLKSAMQTASMLGGGATAFVRNFNDIKNPDGSKKNLFNRFRSSIGGAGSGAFRSMMDRDNVKDFKSMRDNASNSAKKAIDAHNKRVARTARYKSTKDNRFTDMWDTVKEWSGASKSREVLEAKKKLYDQGVGFQKQLFDLASDDKTVVALEGQKKAASEKIIDRDSIEKEIRDRMSNQIRNQVRSTDPNIPDQVVELEVERQLDLAKDQIAQETSTTMAQKRKDQAATIDMYDNLIKVAKLKTINEKIKKGDGRYTAVVETAKVFKSQHMNDETISSMKDISISDAQASQLERVLDLNDPKAIERQMDIIKGKVDPSAIRSDDIIKGKIDLMVDNDNFKIASGDVSTQIAKLVQEEKGKEAEKK